jgi:hypothetical protein
MAMATRVTAVQRAMKNLERLTVPVKVKTNILALKGRRVVTSIFPVPSLYVTPLLGAEDKCWDLQMMSAAIAVCV